MRLLNTKTLQFETFFDSNSQPYAILSHRWDPVETSLQDFLSSADKVGPGFDKIIRFCSYAAGQGFAWVWIDTCCIDKTSSAELSEALNSMYRWYQKAVVCYAYLNDVYPHSSTVQFQQSEWFTRGWTLQELLAPDTMIFLDSEWNVVADRKTLAGSISQRTGIPNRFLDLHDDLRYASIAMKMSWAALRKTGKSEDRAYSLMGIFGVNMPLLYGEGRNAFRRLQLEILKISDDESIFAWKDEPSAAGHGMLAERLEQFADSGTISRMCGQAVAQRPPYSMTHKGLKLQVPRDIVEGTMRLVYPLTCTYGDEPLPLAVVLIKVPRGCWEREESDKLTIAPKTLSKPWMRRDCAYPNKATIFVKGSI